MIDVQGNLPIKPASKSCKFPNRLSYLLRESSVLDEICWTEDVYFTLCIVVGSYVRFK